MNYQAVLIGVVTFIIIGAFHPIVIKAEYYFSKRIWPVFLVLGLGLLALALFSHTWQAGTILSILAVTCFWSIKELLEQEERVKKGWHKANPKRVKRAEGDASPGAEQTETAGAIAEEEKI